jgi:hypothetical protein
MAMKQCLGCEGITPQDENTCRRCGKRLDYFRPAPVGAMPDPEREPLTEVATSAEGRDSGLRARAEPSGSSILSTLGAIFYIAAGLNLIGILVSIDDGLPAVAVFLLGCISALFFGAMCFAAHDIRNSLRSIDRKLDKT